MSDQTQTASVTAELYVRSLAPRSGKGRQESAIDRLAALEEGGRLEDVTVNVWGRQVSLSSAAARTDAGQFVLDRVERFREWARRHGRSVDSFFRTRRVESSIADEEYVALVLPMLTLAEYHDGELAFVAPSADGSAVTTVADRIDALESGAQVTTEDGPLSEGGGSSTLLAVGEAEE